MPEAILISEERHLKQKIKRIRDRLHEIADDQDGHDPSDTDSEERQLQGRLQFLKAELKHLRQKTGKRTPKYKEAQARYNQLRADGMGYTQAIKQIAAEWDGDIGSVKALVNYKPKFAR